ncbi:hypothetical protein L596_000261 [Steinernema carpocapsae]|uniref:Uncharacterized protein n=1 Tax=Steinernema carpocapsae TaxID=34508 RepID=A0A4U8UHT9_STECR|nr:hypothetical protein L596_000261 [Steinernema carpocapsae]
MNATVLISILAVLVLIQSVYCQYNLGQILGHHTTHFYGYEAVQHPHHVPSHGWTGWRCAGVNGIFLDCAGK